MNNFKVGQTVVVVQCINQYMIVPKKDEPVVIKSDFCLPEHYVIDGYELAKNGDPQCFHYSHLRPLQDLSETTYNEVMEWIESGKPIEILN